MECISAVGEARHPTILFKEKTFQNRWLTHRIPGASYGNTTKGWTSNEEGLLWLESYANQTKPYKYLSEGCSAVLTSSFRSDPNQWRLLLLDGHGSHKTLEFVAKCLDHKVSIV
jgi:hypothetical protein